MKRNFFFLEGKCTHLAYLTNHTKTLCDPILESILNWSMLVIKCLITGICYAEKIMVYYQLVDRHATQPSKNIISSIILMNIGQQSA